MQSESKPNILQELKKAQENMENSEDNFFQNAPNDQLLALICGILLILSINLFLILLYHL